MVTILKINTNLTNQSTLYGLLASGCFHLRYIRAVMTAKYESHAAKLKPLKSMLNSPESGINMIMAMTCYNSIKEAQIK